MGTDAQIKSQIVLLGIFQNNFPKMNWIPLVCFVVVGLSPQALASKCDEQKAPLCVADDLPTGKGPGRTKRAGPKPKPYDCHNCYVDAVGRSFAEADIWIPKCDPVGDWFILEQYNAVKNEAFCVDKYGNEHKGSRVKGAKVDCSKFKDNAHICSLYSDVGRCKAAFRKFFYNSNTGKCEPFVYGGCGGNANRFDSVAQCEQTCSNSGPNPAPGMKKCLQDKSKAKKLRKKYIPQCDKNGEYRAVQCFPKDKWCWCAQGNGNPVPKTFFNRNWSKAKKPNCKSFRNMKFKCDKSGSMDHPLDCSRYIMCSPSKVHQCICPKGQIFDTKLRLCNWANQAENRAVCKFKKPSRMDMGPWSINSNGQWTWGP